jgi:hypothetical protein
VPALINESKQVRITTPNSCSSVAGDLSRRWCRSTTGTAISGVDLCQA